VITTHVDFTWNNELGKAMAKTKKRVAREQGAIVSRTAKRLFKSRGKAASQPGALPLRKSGNYRRSIRSQVSKRGALAFVGPAWPKGAHANMLKYGTRDMAARLVPADEALKIERPRLVAMYSGKL